MTLTAMERKELERRVSSRKGRADEARRARCLLLLTAGTSWARVRAQVGCTDSYIARWRARFAAERLAGLYSRHRGRSYLFSGKVAWASSIAQTMTPPAPMMLVK